MLLRLFAVVVMKAVFTGGSLIQAEICVALPAQIALHEGRINPTDETRLDTVRIQRALDHCAAGETLKLVAQGTSSAFLSGPLQLRNGVTLMIDGGVTLFASRDARLFEVKQGSCGVVDDKGNGCKPLLSCKSAMNAGLAGTGIIDGQGDQPILGETYSYRDLAQEARLKNGKLNAPKLLDRQGCRSVRVFRLVLRNEGDALF